MNIEGIGLRKSEENIFLNRLIYEKPFLKVHFIYKRKMKPGK